MKLVRSVVTGLLLAPLASCRSAAFVARPANLLLASTNSATTRTPARTTATTTTTTCTHHVGFSLAAAASSSSSSAPPDFSTVASHIKARQNVKYLKTVIPRPRSPARVLVMGGGLAGLSAAKHLVDAGHQPIVLEARDLLGGKVAAWKDEQGHVSETGLHVFFGAYPNALTLLDELHIADRLQWKSHQMIFAKPGRPTREFSIFDFPSQLPAPFNAAWAILTCTDMLTWPEKIQLGLGLVPAYVFGQAYVESQEHVTVKEWMDERRIPQRVTDEVFLAMSKALGFIGPEDLSMQCVLIALNRFLQETSGSRIAFLDGSPTERICEPLREYIEARGGQVRTDAPVKRILLNHDNSVAGLLLKGNEVVSGDAYINAMPVDALKKLTPEPWRELDYFRVMQKLRGIPVMNIHVWFDRKLSTIDNLIFSRSPLLSVYADMSVACAGYASKDQSMLELVFAPAAKYMTKSDDEIRHVVLQELERLFPQEIRANGNGDGAKVIKFTCVRTPTSVYETLPGMEAARPTQKSPICNFYCAGDFSRQKFLASMEGAILSGQLAAKEVAEAWLQQEGDPAYVPPRKLTERPRDMNAPDANDRTPDRTMYVAKLATTIPEEVRAELDEQKKSVGPAVALSQITFQ